MKPRRVSIRFKVFITISFALMGIFLTLGMVAGYVIINGFNAADRELLEQNISRVNEAFVQTRNLMDLKSADWGNWDDTYEFVVNKNRAYIESNLTPKSLVDLNIDAMLFFNKKREYVFGRAIDDITGKEASISADYITFLQNPIILADDIPDSNKTGIVQLPDGKIVLIVSRAISTSLGEGPVRGTVMFLEYLDSELLERISTLTNLDISLLPHESSEFTQTQPTPLDAIQKTFFSIEPGNSRNLVGYTSITDIYGKSLGTFKLTMPRKVYVPGMTYIRLLTVMIAAFTAIALGLSIMLLERVVVGRIHFITNTIRRIGKLQSFTDRIPVLYNDEISDLSQAINEMLGNLEQVQKDSVTKAELQKIIEERTRELKEATESLIKQKETAEARSATLEQTKRAILNVLEDAKSLEKDLKKERDQAQAIVSAMGEGLVVVDGDRQIRLMNPKAEELLGVKFSDVENKPWHTIVTMYQGDIEVPHEEQSFELVFNSKTTIVTKVKDNHYYQSKSGKRFPVVSVTAPLISEVIVGAVKIFRDATSEKETLAIIEAKVDERTRELSEKNIALETAQKQLNDSWVTIQQEKARLLSSISSLSYGFILTDTEGQILFINPAATAALKIEQPMKYIRDVAIVLGSDIDLEHKVTSCQKDKVAINFPEYQFGNSYLHVFISPILLPDQREVSIGTVIVLEDITERKLLERSRDEFFSIASHELRTPLTTIRGNASMVLDYFGAQIQNQDIKDMLGDIHSSSKRLITIVNEFLDVSRLELGKISFASEPIDICSQVEGIVKTFWGTAEQNGVNMSIHCQADTTLVVQGDPDRVKEVLVNIIGNAIKYTFRGEIDVAVERKDNFAEVHVRDTGPGIAKEYQPLLFRKFQQAGKSIYTRQATQSTGLGLYISRLLVEGMGGKIWLERSEEGKGSTFVFSLPLAKQE